MNLFKSAIAVSLFALSATASAQIVYTLDFPVKKAAAEQMTNTNSSAPTSEAAAQDKAQSEKAA